MKGLPPGTILQLLYLEERVKQIDPGRFLEIGPGTGEISRMLLNMGWAGVSYDLEPQTVQRLRLRFSREVEEGRYRPVCGDFLASVDADLGHFDMVISSW